MEHGVAWGADWGKEGATASPCMWGSVEWGDPDHAWGCPPFIEQIIVQGTHKVCARFRFPLAGNTYDLPENWTITGDGSRTPRVATVTRGAKAHMLILDLDRTLREGVEYTFSINPSGAGTGIKTSLAKPDSPAGILTSFDVAIADGGAFKPTKAGAYKLVGGVEAVTQIIWTKVLTPKGQLFWAPEEGAGFPLKGLAVADLTIPAKRIRDAVSSAPYVDSAEVVLTYDGNTQMVRIDIDAATSVGQIRTSRAVAV